MAVGSGTPEGRPGGDDAPESGIPGVSGLDHTADVGLAVEAPDLPGLFRRAALGLVELVYDGAPFDSGLPADGVRERTVSLTADDLPSLLRDWLREVLHWSQSEGFVVGDCTVRSLTETQLEVSVRGATEPTEPVREIKGVTLHGLEVERGESGWRGQVIFDV